MTTFTTITIDQFVELTEANPIVGMPSMCKYLFMPVTKSIVLKLVVV